MRTPTWLLHLFLLLPGPLLVQFPATAGQPPAASGVAKPVPVTVATAKRMDLPQDVATFGQMVAIETVSVQPRVTTMLKEVRVQDGQVVKANDLLFVLDSAPFAVALEKATATLAQNKAQTDIAALEDDRQLELLKQKAISQDAYDQTHSTYLEAVAAEQMSAADVKAAELNLGYCEIRSPLEGALGRIQIKAGNMVQEYSNILVTINRLSPIRAGFVISETHLDTIRAAMRQGPVKVIATNSNNPGKEIDGILSYIDNMVDPTTGTIAMEAEFANKDLALWPGQYVRISLRLSEGKAALVVPVQSLHLGTDGKYLAVVVKPDNTVDIRSCEVERQQGDWAALKSGIQEGEKVVVDGYHRIVKTSTVTVTSGTETEKK